VQHRGSLQQHVVPPQRVRRDDCVPRVEGAGVEGRQPRVLLLQLRDGLQR